VIDSMERLLPNVIIGGGTKCGSTSLFFWMAAHPDVCASSAKETHFFHDEILQKFNANANIHEHGLDEYSKYFADHTSEKIVIEATPQYIFQKTPLIEIPRLESKPKIIFLLREPIKRAFSQFVYSKHRLNRFNPSMTFPEYIQWTVDNGPQYDVLQHSNYLLHLKKWIDVFGRDRVWVYQSEELFQDKVNFMKRLSSRLDIDPNFYDTYGFLKRNESSGIRNRGLHNFAQKAQDFFGDGIKEKVLIPLYLRLNSKPIPKEEVLSDELRARLEKQLWTEGTRELFDYFPELDVNKWYPKGAGNG
jgi:hypothetical protein